MLGPIHACPLVANVLVLGGQKDLGATATFASTSYHKNNDKIQDWPLAFLYAQYIYSHVMSVDCSKHLVLSAAYQAEANK